ncbi:MAG TPA: hypothetical protein VGV34_05960, partial [Solirubrobacterales bacterium]|nr:hypothetical protein [Solirubrobacterales bacterium]
NWVVQRREVAADGALGSVATLSTAGRSAGDPALAWGGEGTLAMVWKRSSGGGHVIQTGTVPKPPPPPPPPPGEEPNGGGATGGSPSGPPAGGSPQAVDNSFQINAITRNRKQGTATLAVVVPGAGELALRGSVPRRHQVGGPAQVLLRVVPKGAQMRALRRKGRLRVRLTVTFAPSGGEASSQTLKLQLRRIPPRN